MPLMPTDDRDDPGADTAMFRAYVDQPEPDAAPAPNRTLVVAVVIAAVVIVLLGIVVFAS
jgi:hypothetical protein